MYVMLAAGFIINMNIKECDKSQIRPTNPEEVIYFLIPLDWFQITIFYYFLIETLWDWA